MSEPWEIVQAQRLFQDTADLRGQKVGYDWQMRLSQSPFFGRRNSDSTVHTSQLPELDGQK